MWLPVRRPDTTLAEKEEVREVLEVFYQGELIGTVANPNLERLAEAYRAWLTDVREEEGRSGVRDALLRLSGYSYYLTRFVRRRGRVVFAWRRRVKFELGLYRQ